MAGSLGGLRLDFSFPPAPGPGPYALPLWTWGFGILLLLVGVLVGIYVVLKQRHPRGRRWVEGYLEAARVDLAFLLFAIALLGGLSATDPLGNRTAWALYRTILGGYWLTFAIPIVTVGSSVHSRTRWGVPGLLPSIVAAGILFLAFFDYYYAYVAPA